MNKYLCNKISLEFFYDISDCYNKNKTSKEENIKDSKRPILNCIKNLDEKYKEFKTKCVI